MKLRALFLLNLTFALLLTAPPTASAAVGGDCECVCGCIGSSCKADLWYDDVDSMQDFSASNCATASIQCNNALGGDPRCVEQI